MAPSGPEITVGHRTLFDPIVGMSDPKRFQSDIMSDRFFQFLKNFKKLKDYFLRFELATSLFTHKKSLQLKCLLFIVCQSRQIIYFQACFSQNHKFLKITKEFVQLLRNQYTIQQKLVFRLEAYHLKIKCTPDVFSFIKCKDY